jgi:hypothetical protein
MQFLMIDNNACVPDAVITFPKASTGCALQAVRLYHNIVISLIPDNADCCGLALIYDTPC